MTLMTKKEPYCGLTTTRTGVQLDSLLQTASISSNNRQVGNNGWQHDAQDEGIIGRDRSDIGNPSSFTTTDFKAVFE